MSANLIALDGNIRCVVEPNSGNVFNIPNFCISDPIYKKNIIKEIIVLENKLIKIELLHVFKNKIHHIELSNKSTGLEVKNLFSKLEKIDITEYTIRLLAKGQEIKDNSLLYEYNIDDGDKIQISCQKIEEMYG